MSSVLIRDATVLTVDAVGTVIDSGAVYVENDRIVDVGESRALVARYQNATTVMDARRMVVCPGFISTHNHVGYTFFRGRAEDAGLGCVTGQYLPMTTVATRAERLAVGSLTYAEMLRSGVTTVLEMEPDADVFAPFVERLGIRSAIGVMIHDVLVDTIKSGEYRFDRALHDQQFRQAVDFAERWHGKAGGRISAMMTPDMTISSSPRQLDACREAADRLGLRMSTHLGWGADEVRTVRRLHGCSPCEYLSDHGLLQDDVVVAHCYVMDPADVDRLVASGAHVAHCPLMNAVRGHIAPIQDYRERGVNVSLGIDNMFADYLDVIRACLLMARIKRHDPVAMLAPQALEFATIGGARALGMEADLGSIERGKKADLVIIDYRSFGLTPTLDPVQNLVYHAHAKDVHTVMVDGRIVVDGGGIVGADHLALIDSAEEAAQAAWSRFIAKYGGIMAA